MQELDIGTKVEYHTGDKKWQTGIIHAVRKVDDINGQPVVFLYNIDTGDDERVDVYETNLKDAALNEHITKRLAKGDQYLEAVEKAQKATSQLKNETVTEVVRQPKTVDISPANIRIA